MLFNKKFDLIVSLGEDCACSSYMRRYNLQRYSYPLDWLTAAPFENRIDLICNDFERFIEYEDLKILTKTNTKTADKKCDYYENTYNKLYFYHDFKTGIPLSESYSAVKEKYNNRIARLYSQIQSSSNILFIWWSRNKIISNERYINAYNTLKGKFPKQEIHILTMEYKDTIHHEYEFITPNILKIAYDNISYRHNPNWNEVLGNETNNNMIFSQIKKRLTAKEKIENLNFKIKLFFINLIPIRKVRKEIRNKIRKEYLHAAL